VDFGHAKISDVIFLGQSLLLSTTVLNDYTMYIEFFIPESIGNTYYRNVQNTCVFVEISLSTIRNTQNYMCDFDLFFNIQSQLIHWLVTTWRECTV